MNIAYPNYLNILLINDHDSRWVDPDSEAKAQGVVVKPSLADMKDVEEPARTEDPLTPLLQFVARTFVDRIFVDRITTITFAARTIMIVAQISPDATQFTPESTPNVDKLPLRPKERPFTNGSDPSNAKDLSTDAARPTTMDLIDENNHNGLATTTKRES
jgi:hypothetical protein